MAKPRGPITNPYAATPGDSEKGKDVLTLLYETTLPTAAQQDGQAPEITNDDGQKAPQSAYGMERAQNVVMIPWDLIVPDENNFFAQKDIETLAENIAEIGLQHNLVVRPIDGGRFKLISGHRRWAACKILSQMGNTKFDRILCQVLEVDELDSEIMLIYDNNQTRTISPVERIKSVERLTALIAEKRKRGEVKGKTRDLVGEIIGMSGMEVQRIQRVSDNLLPALMTALDNGVITFRSAIELAGKPPESQEKVAKKITDAEVLSTKEVAKLMQKAEAVKGAKQESADDDAVDKSAEATKWVTDTDKSYRMMQKHCIDYKKLRDVDAAAAEGVKPEAIKIVRALAVLWFDFVKVFGAENVEYLFADSIEQGKAAAGEPVTEEEEDSSIRALRSILAAHKAMIEGREISGDE